MDSLELGHFYCVVCNKILFGQSQRINLQFRHNSMSVEDFSLFFPISNSDKKEFYWWKGVFICGEKLHCSGVFLSPKSQRIKTQFKEFSSALDYLLFLISQLNNV